MALRLQLGSRLRLRKSRNASIVKPILEVFNQLPINTLLHCSPSSFAALHWNTALAFSARTSPSSPLCSNRRACTFDKARLSITNRSHAHRNNAVVKDLVPPSVSIACPFLNKTKRTILSLNQPFRSLEDRSEPLLSNTKCDCLSREPLLERQFCVYPEAALGTRPSGDVHD